MKKFVFLFTVAITVFLLSCTPTPFEKPIKDWSDEKLWQDVNYAVVHDTDLILRRQVILNEKLDKIIELLENRP